MLRSMFWGFHRRHAEGTVSQQPPTCHVDLPCSFFTPYVSPCSACRAPGVHTAVHDMRLEIREGTALAALLLYVAT